MPHLPATTFFHKVSASLPSGETIPMPVMTTRRSVELPGIKTKGAAWACTSAKGCPEKVVRLLLADLVDVFNDIAHALELFGFLVGDFMAELLLEGHDKLDGVERIGSEVFNELGIRGDLVGIHPKLLHNYIFNSMFCRFVSHG